VRATPPEERFAVVAQENSDPAEDERRSVAGREEEAQEMSMAIDAWHDIEGVYFAHGGRTYGPYADERAAEAFHAVVSGEEREDIDRAKKEFTRTWDVYSESQRTTNAAWLAHVEAMNRLFKLTD